MSSIKERAERNGKIRRTVSKIQQTITKLETMKVEYLQKAVSAKARGETGSYNLAKSGLNATLTQIKRAKEMLLNIEITAELQRMGETNADFLKGMSTIAKRISKLNKQSNFVKLQKEIEIALSGMEEAQAGLDGFLQNTDAAFAAISSEPGALSDAQIDKLVDGRVSEKELLMDEQIERLVSGVIDKTAPTNETENVKVSVGGEQPTTEEKTTEPVSTLVAEPAPAPKGEFNFKPKRSLPIAADILNDIDTESNRNLALKDVIKPCDAPAIILGTDGDGNVKTLEQSQASHVLVGGMIGSGKSNFLHQYVVSLLVGFSAARLKLMLIDIKNEELSIYNGLPHNVCDAITDARLVTPALDALTDEMNSRYTKFAQAGVKDIVSYNATAKTPFPYIVVVIDEYADAEEESAKAFETAYGALARGSRDAGIYTVIATRNINQKAISPAVKVHTDMVIAFRVEKGAESKLLIGETGAEMLTGVGDLIYSDNGELVRCVAPHVSESERKHVVAALRGDVL